MTDNLTNGKLRLIVQSGAIGLCILALALAGYMARETFSLLTNHLSDFTKAQYELKGSVDKLDGSIQILINTLDK